VFQSRAATQGYGGRPAAKKVLPVVVKPGNKRCKMREFSKVRFAFSIFIPLQICCLSVVQAQDGSAVGVPWKGARGVKESVKDIMDRPVQGRLQAASAA